MKQLVKRCLALLAVLCLLLTLGACGASAPTPLEQTAQWLQEQIPEPQVSSLGGEWAVLGMARSGLPLPEGFAEGYLQNLHAVLEQTDGVLSDRKYTEYSRVILALTALGENPADAAGCNLLAPLGDFEQTTFQGLNGAIFALIALDSGAYEIPACPEAPVQATRDLYVQAILEQECEGGGWALGGEEPDPDLTAMALQALAKYRQMPQVDAAVERGLTALSRLQQADGGFQSWGEASCESTAQALVALGELGISLNDPRFVKDGKTLLDSLQTFRREDGSYAHTPGGEAELMPTEQAFYALVSVRRAEQGLSSLYRMAEEQVQP